DTGGVDRRLADIGAVEPVLGPLEAEAREAVDGGLGIRGEQLICRGEDGGGLGGGIPPGAAHTNELGALPGAEDGDGVGHEGMLGAGRRRRGGSGRQGRRPAGVPMGAGGGRLRWTNPAGGPILRAFATLAQLAERSFRKAQVRGSSPRGGFLTGV